MKRAVRKEQGFTLIELLVVIGIIGILAAIAIPQFASYRKKSYDAVARSDLKNAATAEEAYFADHGEYKECTSPLDCSTNLPGFKSTTSMTGGVFSIVTASDENGDNFTGTSKHPSGATTHTWESASGGFAN